MFLCFFAKEKHAAENRWAAPKQNRCVSRSVNTCCTSAANTRTKRCPQTFNRSSCLHSEPSHTTSCMSSAAYALVGALAAGLWPLLSRNIRGFPSGEPEPADVDSCSCPEPVCPAPGPCECPVFQCPLPRPLDIFEPWHLALCSVVVFVVGVTFGSLCGWRCAFPQPTQRDGRRVIRRTAAGDEAAGRVRVRPRLGS